MPKTSHRHLSSFGANLVTALLSGNKTPLHRPVMEQARAIPGWQRLIPLVAGLARIMPYLRAHIAVGTTEARAAE